MAIMVRRTPYKAGDHPTFLKVHPHERRHSVPHTKTDCEKISKCYLVNSQNMSAVDSSYEKGLATKKSEKCHLTNVPAPMAYVR